MKNKGNINEFIGKLQQHQPQLENANGLTDNIIKFIEKTPQKQTFRFLSYMQSFSAVAAVLLGILFVVQLNYPETKHPQTTPTQSTYTVTTLNCHEKLKDNEYTFKDIYLCYLQHQPKQNTQWENLKKLVKL